MEGNLVVIKSQDLQRGLYNMIRGRTGSYWIGLKYRSASDSYYWIDNTILNENDANWNIGEPSNRGGGEDCVEMYAASGFWNDAGCGTVGKYICERGTDIRKKCDEDDGWVSANDKCYKLYNVMKSWSAAKTFCRDVDGDLVDMNSAEEQERVIAALSQQARPTFWIGFTNKDSDSADNYEWSTGEPQTYTNWAPNEPANRYYGNEGDCAEILDTAVNGEWVTTKCNDERQFLCERDEGTCPAGWRIHKGNCYQFNSNTQVSYTDAKHFCEAQGAFLVSIFSKEDNNFIVSQFEDLKSLGITDIWIGIADYPTDGVFVWSDNSAVTYTNWKDNEPANTLNQHDCGMIYTEDSSGKWNTNNCFVLKAHVCKVKVGQPVYSVSPNLAVGECPAGWNLFGDSCYYASTARLDWNSAETACFNENAHLVAINDEDEQSYISMRVDSIGINSWIGLHDTGSRTNFVWTDGSSLDFENWAAGNPNYPEGGEACVAAMVQDNKQGMWDDMICTNTKPYICEKPKECETYTSRGTDLDYYYRYHPSPLPSNRVEFEVKAASDVHIALSSSNTGGGQLYEIVIGGWENTRSVIRSCAQCDSKADVSTPGILNQNEFRGFWITYDTNGYIAVGRYGEGFPFMDWTDPNPFQVNYIGYSTGFGSTGEFKFCNLDSGSGTGSVLPTPAFDPRCGSGWEYDSLTGNCYIFKPYNYKTWGDAEVECNKGGGNLVSISGLEELSYIKSRLMLVSESRIWIGATDASKEGGWMWSDNSAFRYLNWAPGEPNNAGGEHCVEMYVTTGTWNDVTCEATMGYICKKNGYLVNHFNVYHNMYLDGYDTLKVGGVFPEDCAELCVKHTGFMCRSFDYNFNTKECSLSDASSAYSGIPMTFNEENDYYERPLGEQCETEWDLFQGKCYYLNKYMNKDWSDSRLECQERGADLTVIPNSEVQNWLATQVAAREGSYWIGLHDMSGEGDFEWVDGRKLTETGFTRWMVGEPNNGGSGEDCVEMYTSGLWNDDSCNGTVEGLICDKDSVYDVPYEEIPTTLPPAFRCPSGWRAYGDNCYYVELGERTWQEARDQCQIWGSGSELVSIASSSENDFVASIVIGTGVIGPLTHFWIGLNDLRVPLTFEWVDGSEVLFTYWAQDEPNNFLGAEEDCVEMDGGGAWNDERCTMRNPSVCKMRKTVIEGTDAPVTSNGCELGWTAYGGSCYGVPSKVTAEWDRSQISCQTFGANLVSIKDRYEQTLVTSILAKRHGNPVWIGLNDLTVAGEYHWSDGTGVTFTNWDYLEPRENNGNCVAATTGTAAGLWQVRGCNARYDYLCESVREGYTAAPTVTAPANPTPPNDNNCAQGWIGYGSRCFGIFDFEGETRKQRNWQLALSRCRAIGGDLASFHSADEENYIKQRIGTTDRRFWIGLHDRSVEAGFEWSDGSVVDYVAWGTGEPNNRGTLSEDCVEIFHDDGWNDKECNSLNNWICQIERGKVPSDTPAPPPSLPPYTPCPTANDWVLEGDYCYYFSAGKNLRLGWTEANAWCMDNGGYLASIHGSEEQDKLVYYASTYSYNSHWIGIREYDIAGTYVWSDGTPLDYTNWNVDEPNDANGEEQCGEMYASDGLWNDLNCGDATPFICKRVYHETIPKTYPPTEPPTGNCPSGWDQYGTKCFKIYGFTESEMRSWYDARDNCQNQGGELAIIHRQEIQSFIITKMKEVNFKVYIGLSDITDNQRFRWVDGTAVDYTNWDGREPNESGGEEDCVEMLWKNEAVGKWNDIPCDRISGYMCQRNIDDAFPEQPPAQNDCDTGYVQYYESCFRLITSEMDFATAGITCQNDGYYLASIFDEFEEAFVETLMYSNGGIPVWIGMNKDTNQEYTWVDGWPASYTNWGRGEPSDAVGEGCVMIREDGTWDDARCLTNHRAVCKYTSRTKPTNPPDTPGTCPDNWIEYGSDCFLVKAAVLDLASFPESQFVCRGYGAELASVHSAIENQLIFDAIAFTLTDVWLGMDRDLNGPYKWVDGTPVNFLNWGDGEPSYTSGGTDELCVEMIPSNGKWNDRECLQKQGYVCRASKYALNPTNGPPFSGPTRSGPPTEDSNKPTPESQTGMSPGAIAGTVIGVLAAVCLAAVVAFFLITRKMSPSAPKDAGMPSAAGFDNAVYTSSSNEGKVQIGDTNGAAMDA